MKKFNKTRKYRQESSRQDTSWQKVSTWYNDLVGNKGQYFHERIIIPKILRMLSLQKEDSLLDLGCGQGILERYIPRDTKYLGIDLSKDLIQHAKNQKRNPEHKFEVADITKIQEFSKSKFSACTIILALQNVEFYSNVFKNVASHIKNEGKFIIVLNHPYFRIPRHTGWGIDEGNKKQYRKVYAYMTSAKIPIDLTPGGEQRTTTWSFHEPLQNYIKSLAKNGFMIEDIEEWVSDKNSVGKAAKTENIARREIPMFMAIVSRKVR